MSSKLIADEETLTALCFEAWRAVQAVAMTTPNTNNGPTWTMCIECGGVVPDLRKEDGHRENCPFGGLMRLIQKVVVTEG